MKMIECTKEQFEKVISSLEEDSYTVGSDIGRTHGIACYQRSGRVIGSSLWVLDHKIQDRVWTYEIASYLFETYAK